jgi:hypothetical protein
LKTNVEKMTDYWLAKILLKINELYSICQDVAENKGSYDNNDDR